MRFEEPKLDNRDFQEIVDELKRRIPLYCPEWTDHNVSDPGITMIELFAYVAEQLIYRMNQVPLLHYMKFAQFLGIPLPTPQPARVDVAFVLSEPRTQKKFPNDEGVLIVAGTEVSTTQTENIEPLIFTTELNANVMAPALVAVMRQRRGNDIEENLREKLTDGGQQEIFSPQPLADDAFYFEFRNDLSEHIIRLKLDFATAVATNITPTDPPILWEAYSDNNRWTPIRVAEDTTRGLNGPGKIELHLPKLAGRTPQAAIGGINAGNGLVYSIRLRVIRAGYDASPKLIQILEAATIGRTIEAVHTQLVSNEFLGESDGSPGQRFRLNESPIVLPLIFGETLKTIDPFGLEEEWKYVEHFEYPDIDSNGSVVSTGANTDGQLSQSASAKKRHFTIDITTNEVRLGPAIPMPNGEVISYGEVPERGTRLYFTAYRYGGSAANVPSKAINVLKTSIPYIAKVENRKPAYGGQDNVDSVENIASAYGGQDIPSLDALQAEVQRFVRSHTKPGVTTAVNADDYASLVLERFRQDVTRVECIARKGVQPWLHVYVVGDIKPERLKAGQLSKTDIDVPESVIAEIDRYLYQSRPLTEQGRVRIAAKNLNYVQIDTQIRLAKPSQNQHQDHLETDIEHAVTNYLHPVKGGQSGRGWALDDVPNRLSIALWLNARIPNIHIRTIALEENPIGTSNSSESEPRLIIPGQCTVEFEQ